MVRAHELARIGVAGETLQQLLRRGALVRVSRGLYAAPDRALNEHDQLAQLAIKYPHMVFCLLTALQIHGLTTQVPHEVWVAISPNARPPRVNKIGLDIALEALRDAWRRKKVTMDELWESAQLCRVANVMRPYLESLA